MTDHKTINDLVAHEWRPGVSAGAAARQICRSLGPSALKELLEALLTEANEASHDRYLILDEIKKFNLDFGKQVELARDQASFKDQSETTQARWLGYAEVALAFRSPSVNGAVAMDRDQIALDAAHQIEALPSDLREIQKTARIQLIVLYAIRAAGALHSRNDRSASEQAHEADFIDREALIAAGPQGREPKGRDHFIAEAIAENDEASRPLAVAPAPIEVAPAASAGTIENILHDHFYTGEPGQHQAIKAAAITLRSAAPLADAPDGALRGDAIPLLDYVDDLDRHGTIDHDIAFELKKRIAKSVPGIAANARAEAMREMDALLAEAADILNSADNSQAMDLGSKITEFRRNRQQRDKCDAHPEIDDSWVCGRCNWRSFEPNTNPNYRPPQCKRAALSAREG